MKDNLERFKIKQKTYHKIAYDELSCGEKQSHWMWFIFPQIKGLGFSSTSIYYSINGKEEAMDYINDEYLMNNYIELCEVLLKLKTKNPVEVFGTIDSMKLHSSLTLFYTFTKNDIIKSVIDKYFNGELDRNTLDLI